jgi:hypothetical protein
VHLVGFIISKTVTMHGHVNVKKKSSSCFEHPSVHPQEYLYTQVLWYFFMRPYKQSGRCREVFDTHPVCISQCTVQKTLDHLQTNGTADGGTVVKVLCYKSEGRWFDSRWCHWNFSLTYSFRPHYAPGVDSAYNRNEYQEYFLGVKAAGA